MNRNDFDVPPVFDVPIDVRDRIEVRVLSNLTEDDKPRSRPAAWLAIAAAAAVFIAGGLVMWVAQPTHQTGTAAPPDRYTMAEVVTMDRCEQSARQSPSPYPARSTWQKIMTADDPRSSVISMLAGGKPLFCEATPYRVTLSPPDAEPVYAAGTRTGALLRTDTGVITGVADPSWPKVMVEAKAQNGDGYSGEATVADGLFVMRTPVSKLVEVNVRKDEASPWVALPEPPAPFTTTDHIFTPGDRTSPTGQKLAECLSKSDVSAAEAAGWNPGAALEAGDDRVFMVVNPGGVGACYEQQGRAHFLPYLSGMPTDSKPKLLPVVPTIGDLPLMAGQVPPGTKRMLVTFNDTSVKEIPITANTFAAALENKATFPVHVVVYGEDDREFYRGSFN